MIANSVWAKGLRNGQISIGQSTNAGLRFYFSENTCTILDPDFQVLATLDKVNNLYPVTRDVEPTRPSPQPAGRRQEAINTNMASHSQGSQRTCHRAETNNANIILETPSLMLTEKQLRHERLANPHVKLLSTQQLAPAVVVPKANFLSDLSWKMGKP